MGKLSIEQLKLNDKGLLSASDLKAWLTGVKKSNSVVINCHDRNNGPFRIGSTLTKNEQVLDKEQLQDFLKKGRYRTICYLPEKKHSN